ncbi:MAG: hypothetical protein ABW007_05190 [Chitinophagaceae bacterium]
MPQILLRSIVSLSLLWCVQVRAQDKVTIANGDTLPNARFYLKGEGHEYVEENAPALMALLAYTHQHKNVRYLVMECGPDQAYLANYYLRNGGDSFPSSNLLYMREAFWKNLYAFNRTLPENARVRVYGFDHNRFVYTSRALKLMFGNDPRVSDGELRRYLFKVMDWETQKWDASLQEYFAKDLALLGPISAHYADELKKLLGNDYSAYRSIIENKTPMVSYVKRDKQMIAQFMDSLPSMNEGNILFNYGVAHTALDGEGFGERLNNDKRFRGAVCGIFPYYIKTDKPPALQAIESKIPPAARDAAGRAPAFSLIAVDPSSKFKRATWLYVHR